MAEFQEVMKQWVRVRKATASNLDGNVLSVYPLEDYDDRLIADIEKNVMQWAADHPEPVYPTWFEWLEQVNVAGRAYDPEPYYSGDKEVYLRTAAFTPKAFEAIPADIAQKLGIEPKEDV